jgi:hypothetical protein
MNRLASLRAEANASRAAFAETLREVHSRLRPPFILDQVLAAFGPRRRRLRQASAAIARHPAIIAAALTGAFWMAERMISRKARAGAKRDGRTNHERRRS